eukprot:14510260-Alexandrium_andersonii.AAC.1
MPGMLFRCPRCQALILLPPETEQMVEGGGTAIASLLDGPDDDAPMPPPQGPHGSAERGASRGIKSAARALTRNVSGKTSVRGGVCRLIRSSYMRMSKWTG